MTKPFVCIVIVNWNGEENILNCLSSLRKTTYPNYKVLVLDNGSTDKSLEVISKFKEVTLIQSDTNLGFTAASNKLYRIALDKFDPDYVCNMNNDIITVQPDWLDIMVESLNQRNSAGICGNKLVFPDNRLQLLFFERSPKDYSLKDSG